MRTVKLDHETPRIGVEMKNMFPIGSMYGIFTYIYHKNQPNVVKHVPYMDPMGFATYSLDLLVRYLGKNISQMVVCLIVIYHGRIRKQSLGGSSQVVSG